MKIISRRQRVDGVTYLRSFEYADSPGSGYSFDCDEAGNVDVSRLQPLARDSYAKCLTGEIDVVRGVQYDVNRDPETCNEHPWVPRPGTGTRVTVAIVDRGAIEHPHSYVEPAVGECECGAQVTLDGFTNTCDCGRDYSMSGQRLAPREFWGEETGETVDEILSVDYH